MNTEEHIGECCGRAVIAGFSGTPTAVDACFSALKKHLSEESDYYDEDEEYSPLVEDLGCEVTLTEHQCSMKNKEGKTQRELVESLGFKLVFSFRNPKSGNICRVFMYSTSEVSND